MLWDILAMLTIKENAKKINSVKISGVAPTEVTINNGSYKPLSRPIFIYVSSASYQKPAVKSFIDFYLKTASSIVSEVGYVSLPKEKYQATLQSLKTFK